jgi:hypothetical protein
MADGAADPRRAFSERLIISRSSINAILVRVVDLRPLVRQYYDHPALRGRTSLKAVLPTIAPERAYDDLAMGDGGAACDAWREIYHPETSQERRTALSAALPDYGARDTLALVRLAHFLSAPPDPVSTKSI